MSDEQKSALDVERENREVSAAAYNAAQSGKGLRKFVGATRGKGTMVIDYLAFDESQPATLPVDPSEFQTLTGIDDDKLLMEFLISGFNDYQYKQASDPIAEFINKAWPEDVQANFRTSVRSYARALECSIEEAASGLKAKLDAKFGDKSSDKKLDYRIPNKELDYASLNRY